jgi:hypothetical protein
MNKYTAETQIDMAGAKYTLSFDWAARAAFKSLYSDDEAISRALSKGADEPELLANLVAVCLRKHHPDITAEFVMKNSPPHHSSFFRAPERNPLFPVGTGRTTLR